MSLEEALTANTAELAKFNANFDAMMKRNSGASAVAPTETAATADPAKRGPGRPKKEDAAPKPPAVSFDEMKAALLKVKDEKGKEAAQSLIKNVGGAEKMDAIAKDKFAAVLAAAEAALTEPEAEAGDDL